MILEIVTGKYDTPYHRYFFVSRIFSMGAIGENLIISFTDKDYINLKMETIRSANLIAESKIPLRVECSAIEFADSLVKTIGKENNKAI